MGRKTENKSPTFTYKHFFGGLICVIVLWALLLSKGKTPDYGSPDAVAALFGGMAFAAMFFALALQKQELEETREELKRTADANARSAELAAKNLRSQFIFFWLQQNKERYTALREEEEGLRQAVQACDETTYKEQLSPAAQEALEKILNGIGRKPPPTVDIEAKLLQKHFREIILTNFVKEHREFFQQYQSYEQELIRLTELGLSPTEFSAPKHTTSS